jgi:hypothetical protein
MPVHFLGHLRKRMEGLAPGKSLWQLDPSGQTWFTTRFQKCCISQLLWIAALLFTGLHQKHCYAITGSEPTFWVHRSTLLLSMNKTVLSSTIQVQLSLTLW